MKMKNLFIQIVLTGVLSVLSFASLGQQKMAQSFDNLPENNAMADTSLKLFSLLRLGQIPVDDKMITDCFKAGVPSDTLFTEFYSGNGRTEFHIRVDCGPIEKGVVYWYKTHSIGIDGSTKGFEFTIERDEKFLEIQQLFKSLEVPKEKDK